MASQKVPKEVHGTPKELKGELYELKVLLTRTSSHMLQFHMFNSPTQMTMESHKGQLSLQNSSSGGLIVQLSLPKQAEHP